MLIRMSVIISVPCVFDAGLGEMNGDRLPLHGPGRARAPKHRDADVHIQVDSDDEVDIDSEMAHCRYVIHRQVMAGGVALPPSKELMPTVPLHKSIVIVIVVPRRPEQGQDIL